MTYEFPHKSRLAESHEMRGVDIGIYDTGEVFFHRRSKVSEKSVPETTKNNRREEDVQLAIDPTTLEAHTYITTPDWQRQWSDRFIDSYFQRDKFQKFFFGDQTPNLEHHRLRGFYQALKQIFTEGNAFLQDSGMHVPEQPTYPGIPLLQELLDRESIPVSDLQPGMTVALRQGLYLKRDEIETKISVFTIQDLCDNTDERVPAWYVTLFSDLIPKVNEIGREENKYELEKRAVYELRQDSSRPVKFLMPLDQRRPKRDFTQEHWFGGEMSETQHRLVIYREKEEGKLPQTIALSSLEELAMLHQEVPIFSRSYFDNSALAREP